MSLEDCNFESNYKKFSSDLSEELYDPGLRNSILYRRAVGFFRSTVYSLFWESLLEFTANGGKIQMIVGDIILEDAEAAWQGYEERESQITETIRRELSEMLKDDFEKEPAMVLCSLIKEGILDLKIATMKKNSFYYNAMFHSKIGIFTDEDGNSVVFTGSLNESLYALSVRGNKESVDCFFDFKSELDVLEDGTENRNKITANAHIEDFEEMWANQITDEVCVREIPEISRMELEKHASKSWKKKAEEIKKEGQLLGGDKWFLGKDIKARDYQKEAIRKWEANGRRGLLAHCTGAGKTIIALLTIKEALERDEIPIIIVPKKILLHQWIEEIEKKLVNHLDAKPKILKVGDIYSNWKKDLTLFTKPGKNSRIVIAIINSAVGKDFMRKMVQGKHLFLIADEVHNYGSSRFGEILRIDSGSRLGLSATPKRYGDPNGTEQIFDYFGGIVHKFSIRDGINKGILSEYSYDVHFVDLTEEEQKKWNSLSKKLASILTKGLEKNSDKTKLNQLARDRAKIIKNAKAKVHKALSIIKNEYRSGERWLVYCSSSDRAQLDGLRELLKNEYNLPYMVYYSNMDGDHRRTLNKFERDGGVLLAMKMLDEGVNIPEADRALIIASSKNPREFIQRRGRVLRKALGKHAIIHDILVRPFDFDQESEAEKRANLILQELARARLFAKDAIDNRALGTINEIAIDVGESLDDLEEEGSE